ncbi:MAG: OB-fold nucleic acid binding domain-containing protein [Candidatus Asgardarchaeia archaeon]
MRSVKRRITAKKLFIREVLRLKVLETEEGKAKFISPLSGKSVSRVHLSGTIVDVFPRNAEESRNFLFLTIYDGTGTLRLKMWGSEREYAKGLNVGDSVDVVGKVKVYQEEVYVSPEVIRKIEDPNLELMRWAEILESKVEEMKGDLNQIMDKVYKIIKVEDRGKGVPFSLIRNRMFFIPLGLLEDAIKRMIDNGDIYETSDDVYKTVE